MERSFARVAAANVPAKHAPKCVRVILLMFLVLRRAGRGGGSRPAEDWLVEAAANVRCV